MTRISAAILFYNMIILIGMYLPKLKPLTNCCKSFEYNIGAILFSAVLSPAFKWIIF